MYLSKVTANSATGRFSKWPPSPFWKIWNFISLAPFELDGQSKCRFPLTLACQTLWNGYFWVLVPFLWLNARWPPFAILKIRSFISLAPRWTRNTNKVSFLTKIGMTNTPKWLFSTFGMFLIAKSNMAAIRHLEKSEIFISLAPDELEGQTRYRFPRPLVLLK